MSIFKTLSAAIVASCLAASAHAATFTQTITFDLSLAQITDDTRGGERLVSPEAVYLDAPFSPSTGDMLVTTIQFANDQRLRITSGPNTVSQTEPFFESIGFGFGILNDQGISYGYGFGNVTTTSAVFGDLTGNVLSSGGQITGIFGQQICACGLFGDVTDTFIEFSSVTFMSQINQVPSGVNLNGAGFLIGRAGGFTVVDAPPAPVPLPASGLLLVGAFAIPLIGRRLRRG